MSLRILKDNGSEFLSPVAFREKAQGIHALIFDWDGVFHGGYKNENTTSFFSEADSMGLNMLRFGYFLLFGDIPKTIIITGENNSTAFHFSKREHLDGVFYKISNKNSIVHFIAEHYNIIPNEALFVFDDILDLSLAKRCGLRILVNRRASPLFKEYCKKNQLVDLITANDGSLHAVREVSEILLSAIKKFDETLENRIENTKDYQHYMKLRNYIKPKFYTIEKDIVVEKSKDF